MKTLHLVLKFKWYDMIARGEKKEEYRSISSFWLKKINDGSALCDKVRFHRGYTDTTMTFKIKDIKVGKGKTEWGAPDEDVFIIKLGERIN